MERLLTFRLLRAGSMCWGGSRGLFPFELGDEIKDCDAIVRCVVRENSHGQVSLRVEAHCASESGVSSSVGDVF